MRDGLPGFGAALALIFIAATSVGFAQDDEPPPPPKKPGVRITFLPPPLEGTISLGVYDKAGRLVRTLHREAGIKDFGVGLNGLITHWDGRDDAGAVVPAGKYFVRGFAVGEVEFEGEAFHGNDWVVADDSPRIRRIHGITPWGGTPSSNDSILVTLADGRKGNVALLRDGKISAFSEHSGNLPPEKEDERAAAEGVREVFTLGEQSYGLRGGEIVARGPDGWSKLNLAPVEKVIHFLPMPNGEGIGWWIIDRTSAGTEVKRFAPDGSFVRSLVIPAEEPQPFALCANPDDAFIILLEEAPGLQRVRKLERRNNAAPGNADPDAPKASEWAVTMSKTIRASDDLAAVQGTLKTSGGAPLVPEEKINVRLLPNQLVRNSVTKVDVTAGHDAKGSFLRTLDGLVLKEITATPGLRWVAMMREPATKAVVIFQSDGAVIEEFKARRLASMMAFDAGEYEWSGQ